MSSGLRIIGKIKLSKLKQERTLDNGRIYKSYTGFGVYKSSTASEEQKPTYINFYVTVFGTEAHTSWDALKGSWVVGEFQITGVGNNCIFVSTSISNLGIIMQDASTNTEKVEKQLKETDINLPKDTVESVNNVLEIFDMGVEG